MGRGRMKWAVMMVLSMVGAATAVIWIYQTPSPPPLSHKEQCRSDLDQALRFIKKFADQYPKNDAAWESFLMVRHRKDVLMHLKKEGEYICHVLPPVLIKGD